jgi:hypothetical protein
MVPDLKGKIKSESAAYWRQWITHGKEGGIMPAFAASEKGPLSGSQISTLVHFLAKPEPKTKKKEKVLFGVSGLRVLASKSKRASVTVYLYTSCCKTQKYHGGTIVLTDITGLLLS